MKILYGVVGEGMGHAIRSKVVLDHLVRNQGHEVEIVTSNRAVDFLSKHFDEVHRIHGFHMISEENRLHKGKTLWSNLLHGAIELPNQMETYFKLIEDFDPDVVISDFESWTYFYGKLHGRPIISIDNMQIINRCEIDRDVIAGERTNFEIARAFVKAKLPRCNHYLITTFFFPDVRKKRTTLVPPILRREILDAESEPGEHLLVYQTSAENTALVDALKKCGLPCRVYGLRRDLAGDLEEENLTYRPFSEKTFIEDLRTARGVVASAGFTLAGECVYLRKPMLAVPLGNQFEQTLNARYIEKLRYGQAATHVDRDTLARFVDALPTCERALAKYKQKGNRRLFQALDEQLDRAAAGL